MAASIGELHDPDLERGLTATLQQVVMAARTLLGADGVGLMAERLRTAARSSNRKVADVARDLLAGAPFPPTQP